MATLTVFSTSADGRVRSSNATYATMLAGSGLALSSAFTELGQELAAGSYWGYEGFYDFDTSALGAGATVSAVALSLYGFEKFVDKANNLEARGFDWSSGGLTTADWRTQAQFAALTRYATFALDATGSQWNNAGYNTFAEDGTNFQSGVSKTGITYIVVCNSNFAAGTAPSGPNRERVGAWAAEDNAGTTQDPKLVVTYSLPTSAPQPRLVGQAINRAATR